MKDFRALYAKVIVDKHEDVMAKFGAILAQGIIDAGKCLKYPLRAVIQIIICLKEAVHVELS